MNDKINLTKEEIKTLKVLLYETLEELWENQYIADYEDPEWDWEDALNAIKQGDISIADGCKYYEKLILLYKKINNCV
jgi:hypothetical protein